MSVSRYTLALCVVVVLAASGARADNRKALVPNGESEQVLQGVVWPHKETSTCLAFNADGSLLAAGGEDGRIRLWDVASGRLVRILAGQGNDVLAVAFHPSQPLLASAGRDGTVTLWDVNTGATRSSLGPIDSKKPVAMYSLAFSPDGQHLASGGYDGLIQLWQVESGKWLRLLKGHGGPVHVLAFSPDGQTLASGGDDGQVQVRRLDSTEDPLLLGEHTSPVQSIAFSPKGHFLASGSRTGAVHLWELNPRQRLQSIDKHAGPVMGLAFSQDEHSLLSAGSDKKVWLTSVGAETPVLDFGNAPSQEGWLGALYKTYGAPWLTLTTASSVRAVAFRPDGRTVAWGLEDKTIGLWEVATARELQRLEAPASPVLSVAFSPDKATLAAVGSDLAVRLWKLGSSQEPQALQLKGHSVLSVAFDPKGQLLATGDKEGAVRLWKVGTWEEHMTLPARVGPVSSLAFSPDGELLASGGSLGVQLWNVKTGTEHKLALDELEVSALSVAFNRRYLAAAGADQTLRLWELTGSRKPQKWPMASVTAIALHPNGNLLASGVGAGNLVLWDAPPRKSRSELKKGHTESILSLAFTLDGDLLASAGGDGTIRLWSPLKDASPAGLLCEGDTGWLSHLRGQPVYRHEDGRFLYRQDESGALWSVPPEDGSSPMLSVTARPSIVDIYDFGQEVELPITLSLDAQSADRAYWLRLEILNPPPGVVPIPRPAVLSADQNTVSLGVGLSYWRSEEAPVPQGPVPIEVVIRHAGGTGPSFKQQVQLRSPMLKQASEPYVEDHLLRVELENIGTQELVDTTNIISFGDPPIAVFSASRELQPGEKAKFSFGVPQNLLDQGQLSGKLSVLYGRWPHVWSLSVHELPVPTSKGPYIVLCLGVLLLGGLIYYKGVYFNPMVVLTEKAPSTLKGYPLEQLPQADRVLRRARRLDSAITAAGIPATRWERALAGAKGPHEAASAFAEAIGGKLSTTPAAQASSAWMLSLPPLRLRFARESAVVVMDGTRLESGEAERRMADVFQDGRGPSQVLVLDRTQAQNARQVLEGVPRVRCVVLSANRLRDLLLAEEPVRLLETTISEQIAVSELSPYQVAGGVKLENLFFGREREVRAIADRSVRNFLVVGQRQMGKSSLLLAVLRRLQARADLDACYVELADADLHRRIARERGQVPSDGSPLPAFVDVAAGVPSRPRVWLIDEADDFISADVKAGYPLLQTMRALAEEGRAYFILAGFWDLYRAVVLDEKQPLRNFGEHLRLEPLDARSSLALVTEPMAALGLQWDAPSTPELLVEQAGRRANLLVLACKAMVESLPPDTHALTREHLERALREDKDLRDQGRRWRGDHPLHRAVVRQALLLGKPTREEVRQALKARGADLRSSDFDEAMDHRELSYVLVPDGEGRLYCPVPLMQRYIESERSLEVGLTEDLEDLRRRGLAEVPRPA